MLAKCKNHQIYRTLFESRYLKLKILRVRITRGCRSSSAAARAKADELMLGGRCRESSSPCTENAKIPPTYPAMCAGMNDRIGLAAVKASHDLLEFAVQPRGHVVDEQELLQGVHAFPAAVEDVLERTAYPRRQGVDHHVLAAVPQMQLAQTLESTLLRAQVEANVPFVRLGEVEKAPVSTAFASTPRPRRRPSFRVAEPRPLDRLAPRTRRIVLTRRRAVLGYVHRAAAAAKVLRIWSSQIAGRQPGIDLVHPPGVLHVRVNGLLLRLVLGALLELVHVQQRVRRLGLLPLHAVREGRVLWEGGDEVIRGTSRAQQGPRQKTQHEQQRPVVAPACMQLVPCPSSSTSPPDN